jgi:charged multivesicular body protein 1
MNAADLQNLVFNMKFTCKQLEKSSKRAEKDSEKEKINIKKALEKGNVEAAKIYAQNSIRKRSESLNYLRLASKVDAAASRINTAVQMQAVGKALGATVSGMSKVLESMDPLKIAQVMDKFEEQVGAMDVGLGTMEASFQNSQASTVPASEVDSLLEQIAAEGNMEISAKIAHAQGTGLDPLEKEMSERLERLKLQKVGT